MMPQNHCTVAYNVPWLWNHVTIYYSPAENWVTSGVTNHFYSPSVYNHVAHIPYMKTKINSEISTENHKILSVRDHSLGRMPDVSWWTYHNHNKEDSNELWRRISLRLMHLKGEEEISWNSYKKASSERKSWFSKVMYLMHKHFFKIKMMA